MDKIKEFIEYLPDMINIMATIVLMVGFVRGGFLFFRMEFTRFKGLENQFRMMEIIRGEVGLYILLAIDFMITADIITSMMFADWENLINLAAIVLIRTFISYFLEKEVEQVHNEQKKFIKEDSKLTEEDEIKSKDAN